MPNLLDYLVWRGDLTMDRAPFNPVDGLILAWLANFKPLGRGPLREAVSGASAEGDGLRFVRALADSARFGSMEVVDAAEAFSEGEQLQFGALTVLTGDGRAFVAFRGTDATLVGWKEDFNLSFMDEIPAQREAVDYINRVGAELKLPLRVGGHSKGGNLAVYAASLCDSDVQRRIGRVYNFDGPGLNMDVMSSAGHIAVEPRVETFLPESSLVGILLERSARYHVVKSDAPGALQHSPYTWQVTPDGFVLLDELGWQSLYADRTIRDWLSGMSLESRRIFVDALYGIVEASDARTLGEIDWQKSGWRMLEAFTDLDLRTKAILFLSLGRLVRSAVRNLNTN